MEKKINKIEKVNLNHPGFNKNADPFFSIIMEGLKGKLMVNIFGTLLLKTQFSNSSTTSQVLPINSKVVKHI